MKVNIVCVGRIKEKYLVEAIAEYQKRMSRFAEFKIVELNEFPPKTQSDAEIAASLKKEGEEILKTVKGFVILTAIDGKNIGSPDLAALLETKMSDGVSEFSFVIGGSNGVPKEVADRADYKLSFGKMTYPHQLMRVILSEQIYRAFTIINNMPYHK